MLLEIAVILGFATNLVLAICVLRSQRSEKNLPKAAWNLPTINNADLAQTVIDLLAHREPKMLGSQKRDEGKKKRKPRATSKQREAGRNQ